MGPRVRRLPSGGVGPRVGLARGRQRRRTARPGSGCPSWRPPSWAQNLRTADLLVVPADWLPALAARGRIRPLTPYLDQTPPEGWPDAWSPSFHQGITWGSDVYGLPFHDGPQLLFTRPSLLAARGAAAARDLVGAPRLRRPPCRSPASGPAPFSPASPDGHNNVYDLVLHLRRFGGDLVDDDGRIVFDTAPMRAALTFLRRGRHHPVSPTRTPSWTATTAATSSPPAASASP